jgi:soluble lytic murein transglycosylase-like protein
MSLTLFLNQPIINGGENNVEPWKELLSLPPHELEKVAYNDPRLDSFASTVEQRYGLPNGLIEAVKNAGEKSNSTQQSPKGAKGVMQFIDSTRKAYDHDVRDPLASIDAAGRYFKDLLEQYKGNPKAAIAAYNGGTAAGKAVLEGKDAPAEETRSYWKRIQGYMEKKYGGK